MISLKPPVNLFVNDILRSLNKNNACSFESVESECFEDACAEGVSVDGSDDDNVCVNDSYLYFSEDCLFGKMCALCEQNVLSKLFPEPAEITVYKEVTE